MFAVGRGYFDLSTAGPALVWTRTQLLARFEPADHRVVVVSAGVDCGRARIVVRKEIVGSRVGSERELQDPYAGQPECIAKCSHFGRDRAEIFRDQRQRPELLCERREQLFTRAGPPAPVHRRRLSSRDLPVAMKADEVIEPDDIVAREHASHAIDPEAVTGVA